MTNESAPEIGSIQVKPEPFAEGANSSIHGVELELSELELELSLDELSLDDELELEVDRQKGAKATAIIVALVVLVPPILSVNVKLPPVVRTA